MPRCKPRQINKVVLVGGATRTPLVHALLEERLGRPVHCEIEPDLAVAMGAAVQGGLIAGVDVGPILVDITPHTLGISALGDLYGFISEHYFSAIIDRNTPLPASQTEIYSTASDNQKVARIRIFQGENQDSRYNTLVGEFEVAGLAEVPAGNQILVRLDLDLNGILKVTATERATGLAKQIVIDSATERFRLRQRSDAADRLEAVFGTLEGGPGPFARSDDSDLDERDDDDAIDAKFEDPAVSKAVAAASALIAKAKALLPGVNEEDADELRAMLTDLEAAVERQSEAEIAAASREIEELVFYLEDK